MHPIFDRTCELNTNEILNNIAASYHSGHGVDRQMAVKLMRDNGAFEAEIEELLAE